MKTGFKISVYGLALAGITLGTLGGPVGIVPGRLLIKANPKSHPSAVATAIQQYGGSEEGELPGIGVKVVKVPEFALQKALQGLQRNPNIQFAEPDFVMEPDATANDPYFSSEWHLPKIGATTAWDTTAGSSNIIIAILDTGVDGTHPDLSSKLVAGWNTYDSNNNSADVNGHGTAVAGTAAAISNNGQGVTGVAWNCKIMPVRISDLQGYGYSTTISQGLTWAADNGARVANISYAVTFSSTVRSAAQYFQSKGGVVAVSSGNDGLFDSGADNPYVLTVSATDRYDVITSWSNTGNSIDLAAPGSGIITTVRGGTYGSWSGTSFSAPIVAGAAALVLSAQPNLSGVQAMDILRNSADDLGAVGFDTQYGKGRVNVQKAVALALVTTPLSEPPPAPAPTPAPDTTAPVVSITSPATGLKIGSTVSVYVNATDNVGVIKVELYVDGKLTVTSTGAPFTTKWNTRKAATGAHTLQTKAYDAAGNSSLSQVVTVYK